MKEFADDNFKFDENGRKFSKQVENIVGKREIARYEQFLLFPQCFQKACFPEASKGVIVWGWVKKEIFENIEGKAKMVVTSVFSFFHNVFYLSKVKFQFHSQIFESSAILPNLKFITWEELTKF